MKLQNWVLELWSNYRTATDSFFNLSPPCTTPTAVPYTGGTTWPGAATRRALLAPHLPQHELPQPASPWLRVELPHTPARAPAHHAIAMAERRAESASSPSFAPCPGCSLPSLTSPPPCAYKTRQNPLRA